MQAATDLYKGKYNKLQITIWVDRCIDNASLTANATISALQQRIVDLESGATSDTRGSKGPGCEDPPQETRKRVKKKIQN